MLVICNVTCLFLLVVAGATYGYLKVRFDQIKKLPVPGLVATGQGKQSKKAPSLPAGPPMTILVAGSDSRAGSSGQFGTTTQVPGQRSDVIILVRVLPATKHVALLSIPRDLLVNIPGLGHTRINAAFNYGPGLLVKTITQNFGIQINHYIGLNFQSFIDVADAIGGVEQYFPTPAKDIYSGLSIPHAGCYNLIGPMALSFVRSRHYQYFLDGQWHYQVYPESDLGRIQRQQAFVKAAVKKVEASGLVTNPLRLDHLITAVVKNLALDKTFTVSQLLDLVTELRHVNPNTVKNWILPTTNSQAVYGALDTIPTEDQQMIQKFLNGGVSSAGATAPSTTEPKVNPSSVTVMVLNGSGVSGQATSAAQALKQKGYQINLVGNASLTTTATLVDYAPGQRKAAEAIQALIAGNSQLQADPQLTSDDVSITIGADFNGVDVAGSSGGGAATTTTTTTVPANEPISESPLRDRNTTTIQPQDSSYVGGQYVPPGLVPGQKVPDCGA